MKLIDVKVIQFEEGDYVRTGYGVGIVVSSEFNYNQSGGLWWCDVYVQHKYGCSDNTNNAVKECDGLLGVSIITKEEYDEEKEW